jgi:hypothetical protein
MAELYYILRPADHHILLSKLEQNKKNVYSCTVWSNFQDFLVLLEVKINRDSDFFVHWYLLQSNIFWKYQIFSARRTQKNISDYQWPHKRRVSSAQAYQYLF